MASKVVIGIFDSYANASDAVEGLKNAEFAMDQISLLGKDSDEMREVVSHTVDTEKPDKMLANLSVAGAIGGLLIGLASIAIPGTGALVLAGPLLAAVSGAAAGGALGAIAAALMHFDVPATEAKVYETHLTAGKVLVAVHVENSEERTKAEEVFDQFGANEIDTKAA